MTFYCPICGAKSHKTIKCLACEPPDTERSPPPFFDACDKPKRGRPKGSKTRPIEERQPRFEDFVSDEVIPETRLDRWMQSVKAPPKKRGPKPSIDNRPLEPGEWPILCRMADGIREMLGLEPLYTSVPRAKKRKQDLEGGGRMAIYDEVDRDWV